MQYFYQLVFFQLAQVLLELVDRDLSFWVNIVSYSQIMPFSLINRGAWAQINEAYDQSVPKRKTRPVLIERKQVDKKIESRFGDNIA